MPYARTLAAGVALTVTLAALTSAQDPRFLSVDQDPDGDGPLAAAFNASGTEVLVLHRDTDDVTFIDFASQTVVAAVDVGRRPLDLELTPDRTRALVANQLDGTLTVIDVAARTVLAHVPLTGSSPQQVEVSADGSLAVVVLAGLGAGTRASVVDLVSLTEVSSFPIPALDDYWLDSAGSYTQVYEQYRTLDLTPDGQTLVVPDYDANAVRTYDVPTGAQTAVVENVFWPDSVQVSSDGSFAVIGSRGPFPGVVRLDLGTLQLGPAQTFSSVVWDGASLVVAADNTTVVMATESGMLFVDLVSGLLSIVPGYLEDVALSFNGKFAVGVGYYQAVVVDVPTRTLRASIPIEQGQRVALSPVAHLGAALRVYTAEELQLLDTNDQFSSLLGVVPTGAGVEGDGPLALAIAERAGKLLTANDLSANVSVLDLETGLVEHWIPTASNPYLVAVDAGGTTAVALTASPATIAVIDPVAGIVEAQIDYGYAALALAPDASEAYLADMYAQSLDFLQLNGAASQIVGSLPLGGMAMYAPWQLELALSSKGVLAVPRSDSQLLTLVDVAARAELKSWFIGAHPVDMAFAPDGDSLYVTLIGNYTLTKVNIDGANSDVVASVSIVNPGRVLLDDRAEYAYVTTNEYENTRLAVIETATMTEVASLPLPSRTRAASLDGPYLVVGTVDGSTVRVRAAGPDSAILQTLETGDFPRALLFDEARRVAYGAQPSERDGVDVIDFGTPPEVYCSPANLNSTGQSARIQAIGWFASDAPFVLEASQMPKKEFGYFLVSDTQDFVPFVGGSLGDLCLGGQIGRFKNQIVSSGDSGSFSIEVDPTALPAPSGTIAVQPGQTWNFQAWFRDKAPTPTSSLTDGVSVTFD